MDENLKSLVAKLWKSESLDLEVGTTFVDEVITIRVSGHSRVAGFQPLTPTYATSIAVEVPERRTEQETTGVRGDLTIAR